MTTSKGVRRKRVPKETPSVRHCPSCGKPTVEFSELLGSANCLSCPWKGNTTDLLVSSGGDYTPTELSVQAQHEFVGLVASALATPVLRWLVKYGFVDNDEGLQQSVLRYVKAGTVAIYRSILETRLQIAREKRG